MRKKASVVIVLFLFLASGVNSAAVEGLPFKTSFNIELNKPTHNDFYLIERTSEPVPGKIPAEISTNFNIPLIENKPGGLTPVLKLGVWFEVSAGGDFYVFFAAQDDLGASEGLKNPYMLRHATDDKYGLNYDIACKRYNLVGEQFLPVNGQKDFLASEHTLANHSGSEISSGSADKESPVIFGYGVEVPPPVTIKSGAVFVDKVHPAAGHTDTGYYAFDISIPYPKDENGDETMFRSGFYKGYVIAHFAVRN